MYNYLHNSTWNSNFYIVKHKFFINCEPHVGYSCYWKSPPITQSDPHCYCYHCLCNTEPDIPNDRGTCSHLCNHGKSKYSCTCTCKLRLSSNATITVTIKPVKEY